MKKFVLIILIFLGTVSFHSCYYDKADILYPTAGANCDTASPVSYSKNVVPLLQQQCYSCHSFASSGGGIIMGTYATDKAIAINGKLLSSINYAPGFSPMPKGGAKMNICQIKSIEKWINTGSPNN